MPILSQRKYLLPLSLLALLVPASANSDRIILKDGTIEVSDRVWVTEKYVHFILKGTKAVEVRYAKEIVERIENEAGQVPIGSTTLKDATSVGKQPKLKNIPLPKQVPSFAPQKSETQKVATAPHDAESEIEPRVESNIEPNIKIDKNQIDGIEGISFYDPSRPKRYWAFRNSRHTTLNGAVAALATLYGKPSEWVEANMGDENDLGIIHSRLLTALGSEGLQEAGDTNASSELTASLFHDGERPFSYQTHEKRFFHTRDEALADLSGQYGQPVEWIVEHMGKSNLLSEIHENLGNAVLALPQKPVVHSKSDDWHPLDMPDDLQFYDPRRERKYWISDRIGFDTYQEAAAALARQYSVTVKWIEANMGDTNHLKEIHENIRNSLSGQ